MRNRSPYQIIRNRHVTEKSRVLEGLQHAESNACIRKCNAPKYVFIVEKAANKAEIAKAIETIYSEKKIKVKSVNTVTVKPKPRRVRGRSGRTKFVKKAIVTLEPGDTLDEQV